MECGDASPLCSAVTRHGGKSADTSAHSKSMYHSARRHPVQIICSLAWDSIHYVQHNFNFQKPYSSSDVLRYDPTYGAPAWGAWRSSPRRGRTPSGRGGILVADAQHPAMNLTSPACEACSKTFTPGAARRPPDEYSEAVRPADSTIRPSLGRRQRVKKGNKP